MPKRDNVIQEEKGFMKRKRFWVSVIVVAIGYFGHCIFTPAPDNAESKIALGISSTIIRTALTVGFKLAMEYDQMELGIGRDPRTAFALFKNPCSLFELFEKNLCSLFGDPWI